jgi:hypothetical protein
MMMPLSSSSFLAAVRSTASNQPLGSTLIALVILLTGAPASGDMGEVGTRFGLRRLGRPNLTPDGAR